MTEIKENFKPLEQGVVNFDPRFTLRVLRSLPSLRKRLTLDILSTVVRSTYPANQIPETLAPLVSDASMDVDAEPSKAQSVLPEIDTYLHLLVLIFLLDQEKIQEAAEFSTLLAKKVHTANRRTLDSIAAQVYFYYSRAHELLSSNALVSIRPQLLAALRTATLRKDIDTQATIITLLLRSYLATSHVNQADLLVSKTSFPPSASNNLIIRYEYYLAKIRAIQLEYTAAHEHLTSAIRKAPQSPAAAGFVQAANKLNVVVELLMGDIPERALFRQPMLEKPLKPYFLLVQAVRVGELDAFQNVLDQYGATFKKDGTYTLVLRLRQSVIKTGIRTMSLSYSRISLRDICVRLRLDSEESAEYIVAKAIRDGVIEATLNHEKGYMQSKEVTDVYATQEPMEAFHLRISTCMNMHNECVKVSSLTHLPSSSPLTNAGHALPHEPAPFGAQECPRGEGTREGAC